MAKEVKIELTVRRLKGGQRVLTYCMSLRR